MNPITTFFIWAETRLDQGGWVRRIFLYSTLAMTVRISVWATTYAAESKLPGLEQAAVIAAVTAPIMALTKYVHEAYLDSRKPQ